MFLDVGQSTRLRVPGPDEIPQDSNDGYPAVILDQRDGYGVHTVAEAKAYQIEWLARKNLEPWPSTDHVAPYIHQSRWVADCSCGTVNWVWDENPQMVCLECGKQSKAAWQSPWLRSAVIRVLAGRPTANRNWTPDETVNQLTRQNILMEGVDSVVKGGLFMAENLRPPENLRMR